MKTLASTDSAARRSYDVLVIGSGFGGAAVACRLAQAGKSVGLLEKGEEWPSGPMGPDPDATVDKGATRHGHFELSLNPGNMNVIQGVGLGGGSLHYFGVRLRPWARIFEEPRWPAEITRDVLDPYYDLSARMMDGFPFDVRDGDQPMPPKGAAFQAAAPQCTQYVDGSLQRVPLALNTTASSVTGLNGAEQKPCVNCGQCISGCPDRDGVFVNARNMLTENYLAVAKKHGCEMFVQHRVTSVTGRSGHFRVAFTRPPGATVPRRSYVTAKQVVVAAGTLGSIQVLLGSKRKGLPVSDYVGKGFSGNGDMILASSVGVKDKDGDPVDLEPKNGPSILVGADFTTDRHHIFIEDLGSLPILQAIFGQSGDNTQRARTDELRYLGMGTDAADGTVSLSAFGRVSIHWPGSTSVELYDQMASAFTQMSGALNASYHPPPLFNPRTGTDLFTAHPLGGCNVGTDPATSVCAHTGEVHGVPGLFVADGSSIPTALAKNPSFTISAMAERVAWLMLHGRELTAGEVRGVSNR